MKEKLVCIGNGMAGVRAVEELLKLAPNKYDITVLGAEPQVNYNRIMLSPVLAGEQEFDDIIINDKAWYAEKGIDLHIGEWVSQIDRTAQHIHTTSGQSFAYDKLLIATGSQPFILPIPGVDLPSVVTFRDISDVNTMITKAAGQGHAVVIGGGLLGLEAANGLLKQGMQVTVVHLMDSLLERQLDKPAALLLQQALEKKGLQFCLSAQTEAILGETDVTGVRFKDGTELNADLVVMAVGIRPSIQLAQDSELLCERGIMVGDSLQTSDPLIYSVGECVQHNGMTYGLVAPLFDQAKVCARHLAGDGNAEYTGSVTSTKLKVTGINLFSAGNFQGNDQTEEIIFKDPEQGIYKKLVIQNNTVQGVVLYGDTEDGAWYFQLMKSAEDISEYRERLVFGQAFINVDGADAGASNTAALPDEAEICGCNGVCKGDIVQAITQHNLTDLKGVRAHTKASSSCGSCSPLVEQVLADTLGESYVSDKKETLCECTDLNHAEIKQAIRERHLTSVEMVRDVLNWRGEGCIKCRPALNYYVISSFPEQGLDDYQSRFINERVHANIQKDGTYSVVPRMWGGLTNADELRAIANVVDKYDIPTVKVTGGQRIDLLGVVKEDLPAVWHDLNKAGMISGHAYGKSLRTVKTCVGQEWCRFGTQRSMDLGVELEKMTWGTWTPHKFKMAVSGCPRNCAEATIKDFGVIAVDSGWELHIGGNAGIHLRGTDLLCKVSTVDEVMEYCAAFLQYYREDAFYLERTAPWVERVGLDTIKAHLLEGDNSKTRRQHLKERFLFSQSFAQIDPWKERATEGKHAYEFTPLKQELVSEVEETV